MKKKHKKAPAAGSRSLMSTHLVYHNQKADINENEGYTRKSSLGLTAEQKGVMEE